MARSIFQDSFICEESREQVCLPENRFHLQSPYAFQGRQWVYALSRGLAGRSKFRPLGQWLPMIVGTRAKFCSCDIDYPSGIFRENLCGGSSTEKCVRAIQPECFAPAAVACRQRCEQFRNLRQRSTAFIELEVRKNESV